MDSVEDIEMDQLIESIYRRYGYDFKGYTMPSLRRRVHEYVRKLKLNNISDAISELLRNEEAFEHFLCSITVSVTEMFRDPHVYKKVRELIVPVLKTFPRINIWHAGCCTGEEVYSFAILLKEEGLYERSTIYATDINTQSLKIAAEGIYPIENIVLGSENYLKSGGRGTLSDYYHAKYGKTIFNQSLKENIIFSSHNLVQDSAFNQMHLIICRNVIIYFTKNLQNRVFNLFSSSLNHNGLLLLGTKEDLRFSPAVRDFSVLSKSSKIYKKVKYDDGIGSYSI
ncbi:MAG: hypothetical protein OCD01_13750 [Fibrobacterales bacterium]